MYQIFGKEDGPAVTKMEELVRGHPNGHFMQSPRWAGVKTCWDWKGILVYRQDQPVAALSVLIRPLPLGFSLLYAPRGPVCDRTDRAVLEELLDAVKRIGKAHRALLLYLDPDTPNSDETMRDILTGLGFTEKADTGFGNIQPQYVFRLALTGTTQDGLFAAFSAKTRYNIGLARRKGVTIREYSGGEPIPDEALDSFSRLMDVTGQRDHFQVRNKAYFAGLMTALGADARLLMAWYQDEPIAGSIEIFYGNKAWYLYGASSNRHRSAMPNYLLQWTMICRAMERGCGIYDFRGVPGDPSESDPLYGLYRFKKGFSGTYTKFTGLFTYLFRPVSGRLFLKLLELRRKRNAK